MSLLYTRKDKIKFKERTIQFIHIFTYMNKKNFLPPSLPIFINIKQYVVLKTFSFLTMALEKIFVTTAMDRISKISVQLEFVRT
jgi:hypothetical protein